MNTPVVFYYIRKYILVVVLPVIFVFTFSFFSGPASIQAGIDPIYGFKRFSLFIIHLIILFILANTLYKSVKLSFLAIGIFIALALIH